MTALVWDKVGERTFQGGVDRGVLYPTVGGAGIVWNGLVSVDENSADHEVKTYFLDGVKYLECHTPGDYSGVLRAFTYPDEFNEILGMVTDSNGLTFYNQPPKSFNLSYRTFLGDDVEGTDRGYRIHLLYNVMATPETVASSSMGNQVVPTAFAWGLTAVPSRAPGFRPTAHFVLDSTQVDPETLALLEETLYGSDDTEPSLPSLADFMAMMEAHSVILITDHGDGTWSATATDEFITMLDPTTFQITSVNATYLDPDTYEVSTTNLY